MNETILSLGLLAMRMAWEDASPRERYRIGWERTFGGAEPSEASEEPQHEGGEQ